MPLGWRAPAARHVHDPSPVLLVNSMSMRRDMRRTRYLPGDVPPMPALDWHPVTWVRRPRARGSSGTGEHPRGVVRRTPVVPFRRIHMSEDTEQSGPEPAAGAPVRRPAPVHPAPLSPLPGNPAIRPLQCRRPRPGRPLRIPSPRHRAAVRRHPPSDATHGPPPPYGARATQPPPTARPPTAAVRVVPAAPATDVDTAGWLRHGSTHTRATDHGSLSTYPPPDRHQRLGRPAARVARPAACAPGSPSPWWPHSSAAASAPA